MDAAPTLKTAPVAPMAKPSPRALTAVGDRLEAAIAATTLKIATSSTHDAIIVGGGASGGFAALMLAEAGLNVLVLDAGWRKSILASPFRRSSGALVRWLANPKALEIMPPELIWKGRQALKLLGKVRQPIQSACYAWERLPEAFVDDREAPYVAEGGEFDWYRTHTLGGRVIVPGHGRQYMRMAERDFAPNATFDPSWPFRAAELDPWYSLVERRIGLAGANDGGVWQPQSDIVRELTLSDAENDMWAQIHKRWPGAHTMLGRYAPPLNSLELAAATGRLCCRRGAMVRQVLTENGKAAGVTWHDRESGKLETARAPIVVLAASSLESTRILMLSDIGRTSNALGANLMDHIMQKAEGVGPALPGEPETPEDGRCTLLPRFHDRERGTPSTEPGYGVQVYQMSGRPGSSWFTAVAFGETAPRAENRVRLDPDLRDAWGAPVLRIHCTFSQAELAGSAERAQALRDLAEITGSRLRRLDETPAVPGASAHECGTARLGDDPARSVLDPYNQCWDAKGLYVTDGAALPSQGFQNPTLTIMALTARAMDQALRQSGVAPALRATRENVR